MKQNVLLLSLYIKGLPFNIGKFNLFTVGLPRDNVLAHSLLRLLNYNQGHLLGSHSPGSSLSPLHGCQVMFFFSVDFSSLKANI